MPDRVHVHRHNDDDAKSPAERWARATVTLGDGRVAASEPCEARDNPTSPLSDIETKYRQLTAPVLGKLAGPSRKIVMTLEQRPAGDLLPWLGATKSRRKREPVERMMMNLPLWCLLIIALLPFWLAFWGSAVRRREFGRIDNQHPRQQYARMEGKGARLWAAQQNAWEALALFTAAIVATMTVGNGGWLVDVACVVFVLARVGHGLCYALDLPTLRSALFVVGFLAVLGLFAIALL